MTADWGEGGGFKYRPNGKGARRLLMGWGGGDTNVCRLGKKPDYK